MAENTIPEWATIEPKWCVKANVRHGTIQVYSARNRPAQKTVTNYAGRWAHCEAFNRRPITLLTGKTVKDQAAWGSLYPETPYYTSDLVVVWTDEDTEEAVNNTFRICADAAVQKAETLRAEKAAELAKYIDKAKQIISQFENSRDVFMSAKERGLK